jgi:hypothetical protein
MRRLLAFGDSFTWGTDLADSIDEMNIPDSLTHSRDHSILRLNESSPYGEIDHDHKQKTSFACYSKQTWPALLAEYFKFTYRCYAVPGGSNQTITRNLLQYLPFINDTDVIIINWTYISRWDFVDANELRVTTKWKTIRPGNNNKSEFEKFYSTYIQSELWDKWNSLKELLMAINLLKTKKIKFIMTSLDDLILDDTFHSPSYIKNAQNDVKDHIDWFDNKGFNDWSTEHNFPRGVNGHPLEEAHIAAFKYMVNKYDFA